MTRNKAYLVDYQDFNGGPIAFGGSKGQITSKGKIQTRKLDYEDMYFVKELQHFNLFLVSQMCDKKNKVLFTDTKWLVLSPDFNLPDENKVLLRVPRQHNMYSFNLENIVPSVSLACLITKATVDESTKWHRRMTTPLLLVTKESNTRPPVRLRFSWVFFLRTKDKTSGILKDFIRQIENQLNQKSSYTSTVKRLKAKNGDEKLNEDTISKTNEEPVDQEDQAFLEDLERLKRQEKEANDAAKTLRKMFAQSTQDLLLQAGAARPSSTNYVNTASTPVNAASLLLNIASTPTNQDDSQILSLEDIYKVSREGIFASISYDDEDAVADFRNLEKLRGLIDKTMFIKKDKKDIMLVQVYMDDIIFIKKSRCDKFEVLMKNRFQMSFIEILKKFDFLSVKTASTPIETKKPLVKDEKVADMDVLGHFKTSHLQAVKRIFRKSTTGGCQFLGRRLISWQCKKETIVATLTIEAEYVAPASCCGQVLWIQNQMLDYGFNFMNTKIYIDNESIICIVKNLVFYSKTKHIEIRHHFIRDAYEKKLIQVLKIHIDDNVADLLTKVFDVSRIQALVDGKRVNIKEFSIRRKLRLDDAEGTGFSGEVTPLFDNMLVQAPKEIGILQADAQSIPITNEPLTSKPQKKHKPKRKHTQESEVPPIESLAEQNLPLPSNDPLPSGEDNLKLKELMDLCTNLSNKVLELESEVININYTYQEKIEKLEDSTERLEEENRVLEELKSVHSTDDANEPVMEKEKSSKQERKIACIDADVEINLEKA
nr:hypothetical protein [Tanacetum cinerariifolium]